MTARDSVRGRAVVAAFLAAAVVGGGLFLEQALGGAPPQPGSPPSVRTGAWFCPHGGGQGWRAWVVAANPSDRPASVRVTTFGSSGATVAREEVAPGALAYLSVPAEDQAAATTLEFFDSPVAAGMVVARPDGDGIGAEPCADRAATRWLVPEGTSVRGQTARLVVVNPFAESAVVDVALRTKDGPVRPGRVSGVVIGPRRSVAINLNELVLGEEPLVAEVRAALGKVVVGGVDLVADGGLRSVLGVREPATTWVLPAAGDGETGQLTVTSPSGRRVPFHVRAQGQESQSVVLEEGSVPADAARTVPIEAQGAGLVVEADGPEPFVAGRRLSSGTPAPAPAPPRRGGGVSRPPPPPPPPESTDSGAISGVPGGAQAWVAPPAVGPGGGRSILVLENPGGPELRVDVVLLTASGPPQALAEVTVPAGTSQRVDLSEVVGDEPVAAVVRASHPGVVVAQAGLGPAGYAVAMGLPMEPSSGTVSLGILRSV